MKNNMTTSSESDDCKKQTITSNNNISLYKIIKLFACICIYRLLNAYIIRTQFDPDEYWQTLEPAYCLVFGSNNSTGNNSDSGSLSPMQSSMKSEDSKYGCALTWEWTRRYTTSDDARRTTTVSKQSTSIKQQIENMLLQAVNGPVRSYISILPTYWYYLTCRSLFEWTYSDSTTNSGDDVTNKHTIIDHVLHSYYTSLQQYIKKSIQRYSTYMISKGPMYIHALVVAAPTDLCVWLIAAYISNNHLSTNTSSNNQTRLSSSWPFWSLLCSITSWFHGYALIRTYANSVETVCLLVGIVLLSPELFGQYNSDSKYDRPTTTRLQAKVAFIIGGLSACIRFTSLAAWIPMGLIISYRSGISDNTNNDKNKKTKNKKYSYRDMIHTLFGLCVTYGLLGVILGCCIDRYFYGFWAIPFLGNIHFNVVLGHGSLYGTHPLLWYVNAGIPAICGIMLPFFLWAAGTTLFRGSTSPSRQRLTVLGIIFPYIILHSFSAHKEFRFLLPILPPICILSGHAISELIDAAKTSTNCLLRRVSTKLILIGFILLNYPHLLYLGIIHQRGPIAVNRYIASSITEAQKVGGSEEYSIHYLMGCHSTPLYSHLHIPNVSIRTWHLDCSPDCRSSSELDCESDDFSNNPLEFVKSAYDLNSVDSSCIEDNSSVDGSCVNKEEDVFVEEVPSYIVIMEDDALKVREVLTKDMQLSHEANIRHTIKSLTWHDPSRRDIDTVVTIFSFIDLHFDHMVVYKQI